MPAIMKLQMPELAQELEKVTFEHPSAMGITWGPAPGGARLDLNVPIKDGRVADDTRITAALPTLKWLLQRSSVVAVCSHLGKAKGEPDPAFSLAPVATARASPAKTSWSGCRSGRTEYPGIP